MIINVLSDPNDDFNVNDNRFDILNHFFHNNDISRTVKEMVFDADITIFDLS